MKNLSGRRILITGATGLIGTNLINYLLHLDVEIIAIGRSMEKLKQAFPQQSIKLILLEHNIEDELPKDLGNVDIIFHAASPTSIAFIKKYPVDTINSNINRIKNCLEFLKKQKLLNNYNGRLIVFSSIVIYGNNGEDDISVDEYDTAITDSLMSANAPYTESKLMMEVIANAYYMQYGIEVVTARLGYVYGFSVCPADTAFNSFLKTALLGENIIIKNPGMARRDNIYVEDAVEGLITVAIKGKSGEAYNISSGNVGGGFKAADEMAVYIVEAVNSLLDDHCSHVIVENKCKNRAKGVILLSDKLKKLGWDIKYSIKDGIMCTVKKYLENEGKI